MLLHISEVWALVITDYSWPGLIRTHPIWLYYDNIANTQHHDVWLSIFSSAIFSNVEHFEVRGAGSVTAACTFQWPEGESMLDQPLWTFDIHSSIISHWSTLYSKWEHLKSANTLQTSLNTICLSNCSSIELIRSSFSTGGSEKPYLVCVYRNYPPKPNSAPASEW